jgi:hypothetical protein
MEWVSPFIKIDFGLIIALFGLIVAGVIAYRQENQLHLLEDNLEQLRRDKERRERIDKFFKSGRNRKYTIIYPSYFHGKPVDTVWAGDFFALMTLNNALSAIIPERTFELRPVSPHEKFEKDNLPDRDLIFVCSPRANSMLSAAFPMPRVQEEADKDRLRSAEVASDLPCWFVEDYTFSDLEIAAVRALNTTTTTLTTNQGSVEAHLGAASDAAIGDAVCAATVPPGTTIDGVSGVNITLKLPTGVGPGKITAGGDVAASLTKPILKIWSVAGPPHDSLVSPAEAAYLQARRAFLQGAKTFAPNPKNQRDYAILLRTQRPNGRYTFVLAGIHQYGTFVAAKYLHDLFDPDRKPEPRIPAEGDFLIVIDGQFSHDHFHVVGAPYPAQNGAWIWTRQNGDAWVKLES